MFAYLQSPEKERALAILTEHLPTWDSLFIAAPPTKLFTTGTIYFSNVSLSKLPTDDTDTWVWNQSNRNVTVALNQVQEVTLQKMNTRRRRGCQEAPPSYKVWLYSIGDLGHPPHLFGLWCEKGINPCDRAQAEKNNPPQQTRKQSSEFLNSLSFLKSFVDSDVAHELGWN
mmetsp:Transcript_19437/g.24558  ORF Transcript_19437/g.24558 Transcript_19437/m.24558 type:complete len:171 (-) Transcript_19437:77-589(-)